MNLEKENNPIFSKIMHANFSSCKNLRKFDARLNFLLSMLLVIGEIRFTTFLKWSGRRRSIGSTVLVYAQYKSDSSNTYNKKDSMWKCVVQCVCLWTWRLWTQCWAHQAISSNNNTYPGRRGGSRPWIRPLKFFFSKWSNLNVDRAWQPHIIHICHILVVA